jgi:hypothetical protein
LLFGCDGTSVCIREERNFDSREHSCPVERIGALKIAA